MNLAFDNIESAWGLPRDVAETLHALVGELEKHAAGNRRRRKWYEGKATVEPIGIAIPSTSSLGGVLDMTCGLPAKAVEAVQCRSIFDGFVFEGDDGTLADDMNAIVRENRLLSVYPKAVTDELVHGCVFATLSRRWDSMPLVRFHSAETASAFWDGTNQRIEAGMAVLDGMHCNDDYLWKPCTVALYLPWATWYIHRAPGTDWYAEELWHTMGRPMMEALVYDPDDHHPFGKSRITPQVETAAREYVRTMQRLAIGAEMFTSPQKVITGCGDDAFEMDKYQAYITNFLLVSADEDGNAPSVFQLAAASMEPHITVKESILRDFARDTNIPLSELGVVQENKYYETREPLVVDVENKLNAPNKDALREIALMMLAIRQNKLLDELGEAERSVSAHFADASMPSLPSQADANVKIASARQSYAYTDEFLYSMGMDKAKVERVKAQEEGVIVEE